MKIKTSKTSNQLASTLIVTLIILCVLATGVAAYLSLAEQQSRLSSRSQSWNIAIAVVEAGIEEGLEQLNNNTFNLSADGWSYDGVAYSMTRTLPEGNSYTVKIDPSVDPFHPNITCLANVPSPSLAENQLPFFYAAVGVGSPGNLARAVRVRTGRGNLLIKGMVAKHLIDMNGNSILTDSFDSSNPNYSYLGQYTPSRAKDNGDVATNDKLANSLSVGNANIYGHVITGPGGSVAVGSQGGVGSHAWQPTHAGQIEQGYFSDNANFTFPDETLPYTSGVAPTSGTVVLTNYLRSTNAIVGTNVFPNPAPPGGVQTNVTYLTTSTWPNMPGTTTNFNTTWYKNQQYAPTPGTYIAPYTVTTNGQDTNVKYSYYHIDSIANYTYPYYTYNYGLFTTNAIYLTNYYDNILTSGDYWVNTLSGSTVVLGSARLVVANGINMSGNDTLRIAQTGSLEMYVDGSSSSIGGNGFVNYNGYAVNCRAYFTPNVKSLSFNGNGTFIGVVVATSAAVQMNGGGSTVTDFVGCLMADSIKMNGHYQFHYDEALGNSNSGGRFLINCWDEIDPASF